MKKETTSKRCLKLSKRVLEVNDMENCVYESIMTGLNEAYVGDGY